MSSKSSNTPAAGAVRRGWGITWKLVVAIVGSVIIGVGVLLGVVYLQMSGTLLERSEELL